MRRIYSDAMAAAAARIRETDNAESKLVETLVQAVRIEKGHAKRRRFWDARLLAALTKDYEELREAVRTLADAEEWHLRYPALRCLDFDSPAVRWEDLEKRDARRSLAGAIAWPVRCN